MDHGVPTPLEHRDRGLARLNDMGTTSSNDASGGPSLRQPGNNAFSKAGSSAPVAVSGGSR
ncbi:MAG TPA: hypothetical protein VKT20_04070 [Candidatus Dormibacteraeota bacterium]|nr:hypothetical protein [Candidatus Dormibacteraeota bacterium]